MLSSIPTPHKKNKKSIKDENSESKIIIGENIDVKKVNNQTIKEVDSENDHTTLIIHIRLVTKLFCEVQPDHAYISKEGDESFPEGNALFLSITP